MVETGSKPEFQIRDDPALQVQVCQVKPGTEGARVDVFDKGGKHLYRVLLYAGPDDWGDVDVIAKAGQRLTFLAWDNGSPVVREELSPGLVGAVDIRRVL